MIARVFWVLYAVMAVRLIAMLLDATPTRGSGRGMAIVAVSIPISMLLALAAVMFFTRSNAVRIVGVCVLAVPMVHIVFSSIMVVFSPLMDARSRSQLARAAAGADDFLKPAQRNLAHAIADGNLASVKSLIPAAGDLNEKGPGSETLLRFAVGKASEPGASIEIVKALLDAGANPDVCSFSTYWPLSLALRYPQLTEMLLKAGADPNRM